MIAVVSQEARRFRTTLTGSHLPPPNKHSEQKENNVRQRPTLLGPLTYRGLKRMRQALCFFGHSETILIETSYGSPSSPLHRVPEVFHPIPVRLQPLRQWFPPGVPDYRIFGRLSTVLLLQCATNSWSMELEGVEDVRDFQWRLRAGLWSAGRGSTVP
jgi:hypothetical protein